MRKKPKERSNFGLENEIEMSDLKPDGDQQKKQEQEPQERVRMVEFGQKFKPFENGQDKDADLKYFFSRQQVVLDAPELKDLADPESGKVVFRAMINFSRSPIDHGLTVLDPEKGYQITEEDLDLSLRREKMKRVGSESIPESDAFYTLTVKTDSSEMERYRIEPLKFNPKYLSYFSRLRLQVTTPGSPPEVPLDDPEFRDAQTFEARPVLAPLNNGSGIWFSNYYPVDMGPLASNGSVEIPEGLFLTLPKDLNEYLREIKGIQMEFLLLPEVGKEKDKKKEVEEDDGKDWMDEPGNEPWKPKV